MTHSSSDLYGSGKIFLKTALHLKEQGYQPYVVLSGDGPMVPVLKEAGIEVHFIRLGILRRKYLKPIKIKILVLFNYMKINTFLKVKKPT